MKTDDASQGSLEAKGTWVVSADLSVPETRNIMDCPALLAL